MLGADGEGKGAKGLFRDRFCARMWGGTSHNSSPNPENPFLACQDAMLVALKSLMPACLFNVIGFGSTFKTLFPSSQTYNEVRKDEAGTGRAWVVRSRGKAGKRKRVLLTSCPPLLDLDDAPVRRTKEGLALFGQFSDISAFWALPFKMKNMLGRVWGTERGCREREKEHTHPRPAAQWSLCLRRTTDPCKVGLKK